MKNCTCKKWGCDSKCLCGCHRGEDTVNDFDFRIHKLINKWSLELEFKQRKSY